MTAEANATTVFLRFATIEIIAEAISLEVLSSSIFVSALGDRGCEWFRVHAEHSSGMSHEELELRLAFGLAEAEPDEEEARITIHEVVDHFLMAAEVSCAKQ